MDLRKKYYKIGEVCSLVGIRPYMLRYWEKEIKDIRPSRSLNNQRLYPQEVVKKILQIKKLTEEGYKLNVIKEKISDKEVISSEFMLLQDIKKDLLNIKSLLEL
ncbi:MAG: MerR family transcriptional regulator [Proteobacteria bacterium]|nr:MerR family transcriptional regulator [Pseudomonadota bacterium]